MGTRQWAEVGQAWCVVRKTRGMVRGIQGLLSPEGRAGRAERGRGVRQCQQRQHRGAGGSAGLESPFILEASGGTKREGKHRNSNLLS